MARRRSQDEGVRWSRDFLLLFDSSVVFPGLVMNINQAGNPHDKVVAVQQLWGCVSGEHPNYHPSTSLQAEANQELQFRVVITKWRNPSWLKKRKTPVYLWAC